MNEGFQVFKDGWKFISETGGEANLSVNVEGKNIFLLYKKNYKGNCSKVGC